MKKPTDSLVPFSAPMPTTSPSGAGTYLPTTMRSSTYPTSRLSPNFEPVDQLEAVKDSDRFLGTVADAKLKLIHDQIQYLREQAKMIIFSAERDMKLHRASCSFEKRTGHTYYLYMRVEQELYFSILSPEDWGGKPPHEFMGAYRLEGDMSWTSISQDVAKE
jgi:hypothetical protein